MATPVSGVDRWLTLHLSPSRPNGPVAKSKPILFGAHTENAELNVLEFRYYTIKATSAAPRELAIWIDGKRQNTAITGIWEWKTDDYAGLYRFEVRAGSGELFSTWIRVFPRKMLISSYNRMKQELSEIALDLLLRLDSPSREFAQYSAKTEETSALHDYILIRNMMEELAEIMSQLRHNPGSVLRGESMQQDIQHFSHFSLDVVPLPGHSQAAPVLLEKRHIRYLPVTWETQERQLTYDTFENRLLKRFLQKQLVAKLIVIEHRAALEAKQLSDHCKRYTDDENARDLLEKMQQALIRCQEMKERCLRWSSEPFLQQVRPLEHDGKATQILLKHPTYSRFYQLYLRYQRHLKISRDARQYADELSLRKVSSLYELWSVFTLSRMLMNELQDAGYRLISNSTFFEVEKDYFQFDVQKDKASIILERDDLRIALKYEPIYPNRRQMHATGLVATTWGTNPLKPDLAIEVYRRGLPATLLIFDAKYRRKIEHGRIYPQDDDIEKVNRYSTFLAYQIHQREKGKNAYTHQRIVSSAYILYPGIEVYHTLIDNSLGALPLVPGMSASRQNEVQVVLRELLQKANVIP
jgi:predicted component of viral defense system (DUF524 family)